MVVDDQDGLVVIREPHRPSTDPVLVWIRLSELCCLNAQRIPFTVLIAR